MNDSKKEEIALKRELYILSSNIDTAKKRDKDIRRKIYLTTSLDEKIKLKRELKNINLIINMSKKRLKEIREKLETLKSCNKIRIYKMEEIV